MSDSVFLGFDLDAQLPQYMCMIPAVLNVVLVSEPQREAYLWAMLDVSTDQALVIRQERLEHPLGWKEHPPGSAFLGRTRMDVHERSRLRSERSFEVILRPSTSSSNLFHSRSVSVCRSQHNQLHFPKSGLAVCRILLSSHQQLQMPARADCPTVRIYRPLDRSISASSCQQ